MSDFPPEYLAQYPFVSPILDVKRPTRKIMSWVQVTEAPLTAKQPITASFEPALSWTCWQYAVSHPVSKGDLPAQILYGSNDNLIDYSTVRNFAGKFHCPVTQRALVPHRAAAGLSADVDLLPVSGERCIEKAYDSP